MIAIKHFVEGFFDGPHATPKEADDGPIFLGIKNITNDGRLDLSEIKHISEDEFPRWTRRVVPQKDDIVFTYEATLHRYAIIPDGFRGCLGRRMALIRPDTTKVAPKFLHYYCLSAAWRNQAEGSKISGATVDRIPLTKVPDFQVEFPDLPTQERIAGILSAYDDLIENNRRRIGLLEQAARLLYREWFVQFRFPGHETAKFVDGLPEGWERKPIGEIWSISYGKNLPTSKISETGKFPVHGADSIIGYYDQKNVDERLCLITCRGNGSGNVRRTFGPTFVTNNCFVLRPNYRADELHFHFATNAMTVLKLQDMRTGAAQPQLTLAGIAHVRLSLPPSNLLARYNEIVDRQIDLADALRRQNAQLTRARDLLLPRLMDGRIPL